mmetsp:Transcript_69465/g.175121  ORF Transcript_69465/g.175121 Transcript_69465/m.175121 type:complete len:108 (-) Transcript_69465:174-497(-)
MIPLSLAFAMHACISLARPWRLSTLQGTDLPSPPLCAVVEATSAAAAHDITSPGSGGLIVVFLCWSSSAPTLACSKALHVRRSAHTFVLVALRRTFCTVGVCVRWVN